MFLPRCAAGVVAVSLSVAAFSWSHVPAQNSADEELRHADELQDRGSPEESRKIYESLLRDLRPVEPSRQLGHVLNGLSNLEAAEGNYQKAIDLAQQAIDVYRRLGDAGGESYALNSRGIAEGDLGLYGAAQVSFHRALALIRSVSDLETEVRTLNNLGNAFYFPGQYLEALRAYQEAWQIVERHTSDPWDNEWRQITRINQATLYQRLGRYQSALEIYRQLGPLSQRLNGSDRAQLLTNLGALYRRLGDPWKALDSYRAALDLYSKQHDSAGEISVLKNIGIVYALDQGDLVKAQQFFARSLAQARDTHNQREQMQAHLYLGESLFRKRDLPSGREQFRIALAQARTLGTVEEQWKALYGIGRSEELLGQPEKAEAAYREAISTIEISRNQLQLSALRAEFLADKRDVYDALIALLLKKNEVKESFVFIERSRARTFQDRLVSASPDAAKTRPSFPSLDEIQKDLDLSTILMEFWVSGDRIALIWCTRHSYGMQQTQLSAGERESAMGFLRGLPRNLGANWREPSAILHRLIAGGLSLPSNLHHMLIVPDGWLSSVPFDLVPSDQNSSKLLIERFDISYLPTTALLRRAPEKATALHFPWTHELVAFGDPAMQNLATAGPLDDSADLQPLPNSAEEIQSISKMAHGRTELFLGAQDLKSVFLSGKSHGAAILHVSTHAFADADVPEDSRMLFSSAAGSGEADYVFLRELYDMDLRGVNLATLSACNTERGKMIRGEGVQAFSRALLFAGSRSSLTTLWRVDDQPTSEFMKQFYYFILEKHQPKAEALRSAKLKFLHSGTRLQNPEEWAAFVLNGDGLGPVPRFISWAELLASSALLILSALSVAVWVLRIRRRIHRVHGSQHVIS